MEWKTGMHACVSECWIFVERSFLKSECVWVLSSVSCMLVVFRWTCASAYVYGKCLLVKNTVSCIRCVCTTTDAIHEVKQLQSHHITKTRKKKKSEQRHRQFYERVVFCGHNLFLPFFHLYTHKSSVGKNYFTAFVWTKSDWNDFERRIFEENMLSKFFHRKKLFANGNLPLKIVFCVRIVCIQMCK